jgi:hypothetical protein
MERDKYINGVVRRNEETSRRGTSSGREESETASSGPIASKRDYSKGLLEWRMKMLFHLREDCYLRSCVESNLTEVSRFLQLDGFPGSLLARQKRVV